MAVWLRKMLSIIEQFVVAGKSPSKAMKLLKRVY
jgi:hypothetical protein